MHGKWILLPLVVLFLSTAGLEAWAKSEGCPDTVQTVHQAS